MNAEGVAAGGSLGVAYDLHVAGPSAPLSGPLAGAVEAAREFGWIEWRGSVEEALETTAQFGAEVVPTRAGDPPIALLRPTTTGDAKTASLSAIYGRDAFPLHTDAAHLGHPPDVVILEAAPGTSAEVATLLWRGQEDVTSEVADALDHGVFLVGRGRRSFLAHARCDAGWVRYDPGCMQAQDRRARSVVEHFESAHTSAHQHRWQPGVALVLDNTRVLHGREEAIGAPGGRELRRLMLRWGADGRSV